MIRIAEESDIPELLVGVKEFYLTSPHSGSGEFCQESAEKVLRIALASGAVVVLDRGGIQGAAIALIHPSPFVDKLWAQELGWYVRPEFRSSGFALLAALEAECVMKGAKKLLMAVLNNEYRPRIMERLVNDGYVEVETTLYKDI